MFKKNKDAELRKISKVVQQQGNGYDYRISATDFATDIAYDLSLNKECITRV